MVQVPAPAPADRGRADDGGHRDLRLRLQVRRPPAALPTGADLRSPGVRLDRSALAEWTGLRPRSRHPRRLGRGARAEARTRPARDLGAGALAVLPTRDRQARREAGRGDPLRPEPLGGGPEPLPGQRAHPRSAANGSIQRWRISDRVGGRRLKPESKVDKAGVADEPPSAAWSTQRDKVDPYGARSPNSEERIWDAHRGPLNAILQQH